MSNEMKPLGTIRGGRTKKPYKFFWHPKDHHVYIERTGFFAGAKKEKTGIYAAHWEMAYHAAEAYVFDR